ncbi:MAG: TRAP transporter small permease [Rhodospirillales bacterium]|nr:TRAP transporter small permease [Rhodospirillales bacterium]
MTGDMPRVVWAARLAAAHDFLSRLSFKVAAACLAIIVCSYCYEVVARYFFNAPTTWAGPLVSYMLCAVVFLAAPDLTRKNVHIVINVLLEKMPPRHVAHLQRIITAVSAATCFLGTWIIGTTAVLQYKQGIETILTWAIPKWLLSAMIAYGLLSSGIHFLRHLASGGSTHESTADVS